MKMEPDFLDKMRYVGDEEADRIVASAMTGENASQLYGYLPLSRNAVEKHAHLPAVRKFLLQPSIVPAWFSEERLLSGQRFFRKYALDIMTLLGAMSLPYCYAASPGNKAIYLTEKMRKTPGKRLHDTAHFIIEVMKERAFSSECTGSFEVQKTRLIHAMVRYFVSTKTDWDKSWGVPVNQEDMAGTNLAFSYVIIRGMEQSHFILSERAVEDFLYAWRFIGYQLRIDEALLPKTREDAAVLERAIRERNFHESKEGPLLTSELIRHYKESFPAVAGYFVDSQIRYFVGPEVSSLLGIPAQPLKDRIVDRINSVRKKINRAFVNPLSYKMMMNNHLKLKEKYRGQH
jgi:hypothetical protein